MTENEKRYLSVMLRLNAAERRTIKMGAAAESKTMLEFVKQSALNHATILLRKEGTV